MAPPDLHSKNWRPSELDHFNCEYGEVGEVTAMLLP
jgi:hypothetical protein